MSLLEFIVLLVIAGLCGSIAQSLVGVSRGGCLASIALGFIGAMLGAWIAREAGMPEMISIDVGGRPFPIIWSIVGAALFAAVLSLIGGRGRKE